MMAAAVSELPLDLRRECVFDIDTLKYDFLATVRDIFEGWSDLTRLHEQQPGSDQLPLLSFAWDQKTYFHRHYYESPLLPRMLATYERFVRDVVPAQLGETVVVYQKKPTFRVQLPNNVAVPNDRGDDPTRPGLHCDSDYQHPPMEVNFWLALTDTLPNNSLWIESEPGSADYHPALLKAGQCLRFYGARCRHHNMINDTGRTRVSIDFRAIPYSLRVAAGPPPPTGSTVLSNVKLSIGEYYELLDTRVPPEQPNAGRLTRFFSREE